MSFLPGLPIKNIFKPNTNVLKDDKTQQQGAVEPKDYYKKIRVAKDDNSEIIRSAKNVSDKDVHFYLNQYSKILEVKELRFPISEEETILIKHNADLTKDHPKRVMERLLRQLKQDYGIEEKEVKYEENDDEKIIIEKRNFFSKSHFETFIQVFQSMQKKSNIFRKLIRQLERSSMYLKVVEIPLGGIDYAIGNKTITENGSFEHHSGIKKDPHIIKLFYDVNKKVINGYKEDYTIAEEFIHAGQLDFYGINNTVSKINIEVEAKIIKELEGFFSPNPNESTFTYYAEMLGLKNFKSIFTKRRLTPDELSIYYNAINFFAQDVSIAYYNAKINKGLTKSEAENLYGMSVFTKKNKYLEYLYNRIIDYGNK